MTAISFNSSGLWREVTATNNAPIRGIIISDGKTGYLCDGNDLSALYESLVKILENSNYKQLGSNALQFSKNFSWDKIVKKYIELI